MEAMGPGGGRVSPASSTRSLDLRRLSVRADSAYSSFSAASGGAEPRTPSPEAELLPYLDWDYVRVVWGGPAPAPALRASPQPRPAAAARNGPRAPQVPAGPGPGPLSPQATPLLFALAAEAEAAARAAEPPSPPASRAAYRQRLQGAQRRVLRETSFQRKELRMSLPARLRPAAPGRPPAAHPRSASLGHGEGEAARPGAPAPGTAGPGRLAHPNRQQQQWCLSEPGKPDGPGPGAGMAGECSSFGFARPETQEWQHQAGAEFEGHQIRWLRGTEDPEPLSWKLDDDDHAYRPAPRTQSAAPGEAVGPWGVQAVLQGAEPRPLFQATHPSVRASDPHHAARWGQRPGGAPEHPLQGLLETAGTGDCWSAGCRSPGTANGDVPTADSAGLLTTDFRAAGESDSLTPLPADAPGPPGRDTPGPPDDTASAWGTVQPGSKPAWPSPRLEQLVQELARLDPSLSDSLTSYPSPEPPLDLLDGLIPLAEVWAAMRPARGRAGEEAAGVSEPGSTRVLPTSQEEMRPEHLTPHPVSDRPCGQGLPEPSSIHAKKAELADLLQEMLRGLQAEQEQLQGTAQTWARRGAALEAAVGQACAPRELERFSRFMADLERVLGLLLLLGSRLARVHRALARTGAHADPEEQACLLQRLGLLQRQQEDARELKEHVARRERTLREVLVRALPAGELRAYCALLAGKAAVLAQQRSLDERVRLLQDQLDAVRSGLGHQPPSPRPASSPGTRPPDTPPFSPLLI
uniref:Shroom family member 1 n=1 Tax=Pipistrellus kuhlii TaxID=59472 RepID=A0A7J7XCC3_PIPKU|nr:shroom family member 1 [Pipistrellus kuhlii]